MVCTPSAATCVTCRPAPAADCAAPPVVPMADRVASADANDGSLSAEVLTACSSPGQSGNAFTLLAASTRPAASTSLAASKLAALPGASRTFTPAAAFTLGTASAPLMAAHEDAQRWDSAAAPHKPRPPPPRPHSGDAASTLASTLPHNSRTS
eukprot:366360-Chlamydomonas_euryale.AAC.5